MLMNALLDDDDDDDDDDDNTTADRYGFRGTFVAVDVAFRSSLMFGCSVLG